MLDPQLEPEARRLALAAALTGQARRALNTRIPLTSTADDLVAFAHRIGDAIQTVERTHALRFEPALPGVTAGPENASAGLRLVLACAAFHADATPLGIVFTTLIAGRWVQIAVAPDVTPIPPDWHPL
jgi:hypothetical protein